MWRQVTNTDWHCLNREGRRGQREKGHRGENSDSSERENTSGSINTLNLVPAREHDSCSRLPDFASFSPLHPNPLHHLLQGATVRGPIQPAPFPSLLSSAHQCLENKALWNERPSLSALRCLGHYLHDNPPAEACELMTDEWDERSGIGGWLLLLGEEKRMRVARQKDSWVISSHCSLPVKYQFTP